MIEGVPERFPKPNSAIEGGFGWVPPIAWRMDKHCEVPQRGAACQAPALRILRSNFWFTTQPMEEPEAASHLGR